MRPEVRAGVQCDLLEVLVSTGTRPAGEVQVCRNLVEVLVGTAQCAGQGVVQVCRVTWKRCYCEVCV